MENAYAQRMLSPLDDDGLPLGATCNTCARPLEPHVAHLDHLVVVLECARHGVERIVEPFGRTAGSSDAT